MGKVGVVCENKAKDLVLVGGVKKVLCPLEVGISCVSSVGGKECCQGIQYRRVDIPRCNGANTQIVGGGSSRGSGVSGE